MPQQAGTSRSASSTPARSARGRGFSLIEVLVVLVILTVLAGILVPAVSSARSAERGIACLSNLREISIGLQLYTQHNRESLPDPDASGCAWEASLRDYVRPDFLFACPADRHLYPIAGSSYDWRDTGNPLTTLAGRSFHDARWPGAILVFDALPGWHSAGKLNAITVEGAAMTFDQDRAFRNLDWPIGTPPRAGL